MVFYGYNRHDHRYLSITWFLLGDLSITSYLQKQFYFSIFIINITYLLIVVPVSKGAA
ncbi:hypothetical protein BD408DRAFT_408635 [Parasitella parasitica]|nr:hypothetical protein BD408DRAFT_408635 [Parasitella parasitica]